MSKPICSGAIVLAIFGSSFASAQTGPGANHLNLTPQERTVCQWHAASPSQAAPSGMQPQVGDLLPYSLSAHALQSGVSNQILEAKQLHSR